jgi:hypothetical protein
LFKSLPFEEKEMEPLVDVVVRCWFGLFSLELSKLFTSTVLPIIHRFAEFHNFNSKRPFLAWLYKVQMYMESCPTHPASMSIYTSRFQIKVLVQWNIFCFLYHCVTIFIILAWIFSELFSPWTWIFFF